MQYKLLIADDDRDIQRMLKDYLELSGYIVYAAYTGLEAMDMLSVNPDLILLDINMPELDGIAFCKKVRNHIPIPILFLTAKIEEQDRVNGFMAGGDDYIIKPFSMDELLARIMAHLRREERTGKKKSLRAAGNCLINYDERQVWVDERPITFTKTEFDIIELLSSNKGRVYDKETIYERLWGFEKDGSSTIITEHILRIRSKFAKESEKMERNMP